MPKALVIDDEAPLTTLIGRFLENADFSVETATSGLEGLNKATSTRPDVVILDIMMPDIDGYEVCRRLRADPRTARGTIVVLTARTQPVDKQMALRVGADLHLVKPFSGKALVEEVKRLLEARSFPAQPRGCQIAVLRLQPAAGATMLATNLALSLAEDKGRLVAVVDLVLTGGQIGSALGLMAQRSWAESVPEDRKTDWLAAHMLQHNSRLFVLPAPALPPGVALPDPAAVAQILNLLQRWFDYVVIDLPLALGPFAPALLESSSLALLLLSPDQALLRPAQFTLAAIKKYTAKPLPVWPIVNGPATGQELFCSQVEQALGLPVAAVLPWSLDQATASQSPAMLSQPGSPLAAAIRTLAQQVINLPADESQE